MIEWTAEQYQQHLRDTGQVTDPITPPAKGNKYSAVKTEIDGHVFPSKAEARRYVDLKRLQDAGEITDLELQPKFPLIVNGKKVGRFTADFQYRDGDGATVIEDVKGFSRGEAYRLRKKLVEACHGIEIVEVSR
jgi:hypothetical protein